MSQYKYRVENLYRTNWTSKDHPKVPYSRLILYNADNLHDFEIVDTTYKQEVADEWINQYQAEVFNAKDRD